MEAKEVNKAEEPQKKDVEGDEEEKEHHFDEGAQQVSL